MPSAEILAKDGNAATEEPPVPEAPADAPAEASPAASAEGASAAAVPEALAPSEPQPPSPAVDAAPAVVPASANSAPPVEPAPRDAPAELHVPSAVVGPRETTAVARRIALPFLLVALGFSVGRLTAPRPSVGVEPAARNAQSSVEPPPTATLAPAPALASAPSRTPASSDDPVVLNTATVTDLRRLPGIGDKRANAILALRARLGRFRAVEDLLKVKGIGRAMLKRLRPLVRVDPGLAPGDAGAPAGAVAPSDDATWSPSALG